jgi:23S rRNA (adenine2503-C2)-methyltransferase
MDKDLKDKTVPQLQQIAEKSGVNAYLAKYIFSFIHQYNTDDIGLITPLPKDLRTKLVDDGFFISQLKIIEKLIDPDGTVKYLFETADGQKIESVLLDETGRKTICLSTQIGCRLGCKFCATGYLKFQRNLTAGEIADEVIKISADSNCKINNLVYMGMGEPLDNYENTLRAVRILADQSGKKIGIRRQTISTVGLPAGIRKLADEDIYPRLAVSLHAADNNLRKQIVPAANKYPLPQLINAMKYYQQKTDRRITIEYCMMENINDSLDCVRKLAQLLKGLKAGVNLIEYNPHPGACFKASPKERIKAFKDFLMQSGFETIIRYRRGRSIKAACGQLGADRIKKEAGKKHKEN